MTCPENGEITRFPTLRAVLGGVKRAAAAGTPRLHAPALSAAAYSSLGGVVATMKVRSPRPVLWIACSTPGGM